MTTPLIMLTLLIAPWLVCRVTGLARGTVAAAWGAGLLFAFTGVGHFIRTAEMALMLPEWVPARPALVYATGVLELLVAAGLFVPHWRRRSATVALLLLVAFLPVNIYSAVVAVPMGGHAWGPVYLWIRVPLQALIFGWIYLGVVRRA